MDLKLTDLSKTISEITNIDERIVERILKEIPNELIFQLTDWHTINIKWICKLYSAQSNIKLRYDTKRKISVKTKPRRKIKCRVHRSIQNKILAHDKTKKN